MRPSKSAVKERSSSSREPASGKENVADDMSLKRALCPALALPNDPSIRVCIYALLSFLFTVCHKCKALYFIFVRVINLLHLHSAD